MCCRMPAPLSQVFSAEYALSMWYNTYFYAHVLAVFAAGVAILFLKPRSHKPKAQ